MSIVCRLILNGTEHKYVNVLWITAEEGVSTYSCNVPQENDLMFFENHDCNEFLG